MSRSPRPSRSKRSASKPLAASKPSASSLASARYRAQKLAEGWVHFSCFVPIVLRPPIKKTIRRSIMIWRAKQTATNDSQKV